MWRVGADVFFEGLDEFQGNERVFRPRVNPFEQFSEQHFRNKYRFTKEIFGELLDILDPALERYTHRSQSLDPSLQLSIAVRYFAQGRFLPMVGDVHGVGPRTASRCIHTVAQAICDRMDRFIQWPHAEAVLQAKQRFYERYRFPCILGLIDGSQVPIHSPFTPANEGVYVCRKGFHSINTQIICDANLNILDIDARWPGSTHDAFILHNSHIWDRFENVELTNTWLLGDSGYPLRKWLLTPFLNPANQAEERFNRRHKHIRSIIERCNGVLKMRWRCLTKPIMFHPPRASRIIASCGALHNFAISHGLYFDEEIDDDVINEHNVHAPYVDHLNAGNDGVRVRAEIVRRIFTRN